MSAATTRPSSHENAFANIMQANSLQLRRLRDEILDGALLDRSRLNLLLRDVANISLEEISGSAPLFVELNASLEWLNSRMLLGKFCAALVAEWPDRENELAKLFTGILSEPEPRGRPSEALADNVSEPDARDPPAALFTGKLSEPSAQDRRPPGWLGWWSERYAHVIDRSLFPRRPFQASELTLALANVRSTPFAEALEPVASKGEPRDRDKKLLPWRFARSATHDLFGNWGVAFGALTVGLVVLNFAISHSVGQATSRERAAPVRIDPKGADTPPPSQPVNPGVTDVLPNANEQRPRNPANPLNPVEQRPANVANPANPARIDPAPSNRVDPGANWPQNQQQQQQQQQQSRQPDLKSDGSSTSSNVEPSKQPPARVPSGGNNKPRKVPKS